jgi:hypothetical protein
VSNSEIYYSHFYPLLFLIPAFAAESIDCPPFRIVTRKWQTSTFDLATLATRHKLHLPYQLMDVLLSQCNLELSVGQYKSLEEANKAFRAFRIGAYSVGLSPFLCPFVSTHSINEYSGINSRDNNALGESLHPGLRDGITSDSAQIEVWPVELSLRSIIISDAISVKEQPFREASDHALKWLSLTKQFPALLALEEATIASPTMGDQSQSLLHIWSALESLFPTVSSEVSFRVAIYIAQLTQTGANRLDCYTKIRSAYGIRSKLAHGSKTSTTHEEWNQAWNILIDCINALVKRRHLPTEQELIQEIFS